MAVANSPIELPTGRRSIYFDQTSAPDVHDPNWIPVLDAGAINGPNSVFSEKEVSPYNAASFSPFPEPPSDTRAASPTKRTQLAHSHSKSSVAPEAAPTELEAEPLPPRSSSRQPVPGPHSEHQRDASDSRDTSTSDADGSSAPSTAGTTSLLEEQYYTLPGLDVTKDDIQAPIAPMSARSSMGAVSVMSTRTKASFAPTSKYSRKNVQSIVSVRPPTIQSQPTTPQESPRVPPAMPSSSSSLPLLEQQTPAPLATVPLVPAPLPTPPLTTSKQLTSSKSTASERRLRALHSHPSSNSLAQSSPPLPQSTFVNGSRSRANSTSNEYLEPEISALPRPPSVKHKPRKSTDHTSRPTTPRLVYDSQQPTPAPTTPLPQLPPEAFANGSAANSRRPSVRTLRQPSESHIASASLHNVPVPKTPADHTEMADFMSRKSTVIFRRFDDVHVKLLLCLQDEISQLEEELFALENAQGREREEMGQLERPGQKMRVMRELRRVVAEYGMFTSFGTVSMRDSADLFDRSPIRELVADASQQSFATGHE
jgi:hypothetical protein